MQLVYKGKRNRKLAIPTPLTLKRDESQKTTSKSDKKTRRSLSRALEEGEGVCCSYETLRTKKKEQKTKEGELYGKMEEKKNRSWKKKKRNF